MGLMNQTVVEMNVLGQLCAFSDHVINITAARAVPYACCSHRMKATKLLFEVVVFCLTKCNGKSSLPISERGWIILY